MGKVRRVLEDFHFHFGKKKQENQTRPDKKKDQKSKIDQYFEGVQSIWVCLLVLFCLKTKGFPIMSGYWLRNETNKRIIQPWLIVSNRWSEKKDRTKPASLLKIIPKKKRGQPDIQFSKKASRFLSLFFWKTICIISTSCANEFNAKNTEKQRKERNENTNHWLCNN